MTLRLLAAVLLAAASAPLFAEVTPAAPAQTPAPAEEVVPVAIDTAAGRIVVALDKTHSPVTTANFLRYVDAHRFDGETFYRAMHAYGGGLIQGGVRSDMRKLFPPIADEPTSVTGLSNVTGAISMARGEPNSARADFFIMVSDQKGLDAGANPQDPNGFPVFGRVVEGMDVVKKIFDAPVSATKGEGSMKGQMLDPPVKILKATRIR
jgi:peptidyl-prolyl cis-trans isomerase A (cyclophilin A)